MTTHVENIESEMIDLLASQMPSEILKVISEFPSDMLNNLISDDDFVHMIMNFSFPGVLEVITQEELARTTVTFRETLKGLVTRLRQQNQVPSNTTAN